MALRRTLAAATLALAVPLFGQGKHKFQKMNEPEVEASGYSVMIVSADGEDEASFNDNVRYTLSGSDMKNRVAIKATSKAELSKEFGRIATATLADLGLKPFHAASGKSAVLTSSSATIMEEGGWEFIPKDADSFKTVVRMVKYLGNSREGALTGTVTQLKVVLVPNDIRFESGEAGFLPRIKVISGGSFKTGSAHHGATVSSLNQDSSKIEKAILASFRKRAYDDEAKAVEQFSRSMLQEPTIPEISRKRMSEALMNWAAIVRAGKPRTRLLVELDDLKKKLAPKADKKFVDELTHLRDYLCESAIIIDLRYL